METLRRTQASESDQQVSPQIERAQDTTEQRVDVEIGDIVLVMRSDNTIEHMRVSAISDPKSTFDSLHQNAPAIERMITVVGNLEEMIDDEGRRVVALPSKVLPENFFTTEHQGMLAELHQRDHPERVARDIASIALYQIPNMRK